MKEVERVSKWDSIAVVSDTPLVDCCASDSRPLFRVTDTEGGKSGMLEVVWKLDQSRFSLVPRPHPKNRERGLVSLAKISVCAKSAYCTTHSNNHIPTS